MGVNWGPWGEAGMAAVGTKAHELSVANGERGISRDTSRFPVTRYTLYIHLVARYTLSHAPSCEIHAGYIWRISQAGVCVYIATSNKCTVSPYKHSICNVHLCVNAQARRR